MSVNRGTIIAAVVAGGVIISIIISVIIIISSIRRHPRSSRGRIRDGTRGVEVVVGIRATDMTIDITIGLRTSSTTGMEGGAVVATTRTRRPVIGTVRTRGAGEEEAMLTREDMVTEATLFYHPEVTCYLCVCVVGGGGGETREQLRYVSSSKLPTAACYI